MVHIENDVGIIIPVYNRPTLVIKTMESVAAQTKLPGKVVVVDDGSTDNTAKVIQNWIENIKIPLNISLVSTENLGVSAARNYGLHLVREYEFVVFLDSDDLLPNSFIECLTPHLRQDSKAVAVSCDKLIQNLETGSQFLLHFAQVQHDPISFMLKRGGAMHSCSIFRSKYVFDAGSFDESLITGEDTVLFLQLALLGPWLYLPTEPVIYKIHNMANEEGHLSKKYKNSFRIWANNYETFICNVNPEHPKLKKWQIKLSARWFYAGEVSLKRFLFSDAIYCFSRAFFWLISSIKR